MPCCSRSKRQSVQRGSIHRKPPSQSHSSDWTHQQGHRDPLAGLDAPRWREEWARAKRRRTLNCWRVLECFGARFHFVAPALRRRLTLNQSNSWNPLLRHRLFAGRGSPWFLEETCKLFVKYAWIQTSTHFVKWCRQHWSRSAKENSTRRSHRSS